LSFLKDLGSHPDYQRLLNSAKEKRPVIPAWEPGADNTEQWKDASAMQRGFDIAMLHFTPK
jgi:hypothetical protein